MSKVLPTQPPLPPADSNDKLRDYRRRFCFHNTRVKRWCIFTGNSLGLQPKTTVSYIQQELDDWAWFGVEGHFFQIPMVVVP